MDQAMIQDSQMDRVNDDSDINWQGLLQTLISHWRLLTLGPILAGALALGLSYFITPTFTATTTFITPQQQQSTAVAMLQSLGSLGGLAGVAPSIRNPADQYISFLKSRNLQDALAERLQIKARDQIATADETRAAISARTLISSGKDGLITISVEDKDPVFAAQLANAHVEELTKLLGRLAVTEAQQRRRFFEKQLLQTKTSLTRAEQALKNTGVNASALKANPVAAVTAVAQLQAQITAKEVTLASMRGYLTESAPPYKHVQAELAALKAEISKVSTPDSEVAVGDSDYVARYRDFKYQETLFEMFAKQFEIAKIDESREGATVQVLDIAQPPERKSKPKRLDIALSTTFGAGIFLIFFVFIRQTMRKQAT